MYQIESLYDLSELIHGTIYDKEKVKARQDEIDREMIDAVDRVMLADSTEILDLVKSITE